MKSKKDIQLELLQEVDDICSKNNLNYILTGLNSLNAYLNHTLRNGPISVAIAMTQGDIKAFCKIIDENYGKERYVEGIFNNPNYDKAYVVYGNKNTTDFHIVKPDNNIHHGININIYPITKIQNQEGWKKLANKAFNKIYRLSNGKIFENLIFLNKWEDIQKYPSVHIINKNYKSKILKEIMKYEIDGIELCLPKDADSYFKKMYGKNFKTKEIIAKTQGERVIIDTNHGYEEIMNEVEDLILNARANDNEIKSERKKADDEFKTVASVWDLVQMTSKQVEYIHYFEKNADKLLTLDLNDEKQFKEAYGELKPVISTLSQYSKKGMTFSINPEIDELIDNVLLKKNKKLLNKIKELKTKEYFIE